MNKAVIIMGSESDKDFVKQITDELTKLEVEFEENVASAHKQPKEVLEILETNEKGDDKIVYITIAGRSNALSGFCSANTKFPVIACPPFKDKDDYLVNIHSTLQMPSNTPALTVIYPKNAALAAKRILDLA